MMMMIMVVMMRRRSREFKSLLTSWPVESWSLNAPFLLG